MKVGSLLNKEIEHIPSFKNNYKVQRCKLKVKNKEIEQNLLLKKCQNFFKEINNNNNNKKNDNNWVSTDKFIFPNKTKTAINLPFIVIPNLKLESINKNKKNSIDKNKISNSAKNTKIQKTRNKNNNITKSKTTEKRIKTNCKINERFNRRYYLIEKTLNKLKKPLFYNHFQSNENYNSNNIYI